MHKLKLTLGVLMIAALFVPLSECSHAGKANDLPLPAKTGLQKFFPRSDAQTDYSYGATRIDLSMHGVSAVVAFGWPLVIALLERRGQCRPTRFICLLELLLCAGTVWWIYAVSEGGRRLWGAFFVFGLMGLYAIAALIDLFGDRPPKMTAA